MVKLSIIVPVYQVEQYLERFIYSVLSQNYEKYELILIDDGSSDRSGRICDEFSEKYPHIRTIHKKNGGVSSARNEGIKNAKGQYIIFGDADDYYDSTFLNDISVILEKNSQDICICGYYHETNRGLEPIIPQMRGAYSRKSLSNKFEKLLKDNSFNSVWNKVFRLDIIKENQIAFPIQKIAEDGIFVCRYLQKVESLYFVDKAYYHYCQNEGSAVHKYCASRWEDESKYLKEMQRCVEYLAPEQMKVIMGIKYRNAVMFDLYNLLESNSSIYSCSKVLKEHLKQNYSCIDWNMDTQEWLLKIQIKMMQRQHILVLIALMRLKKKINRWGKRDED